MNHVSLETFSKELLNIGISNTYEYPGYISIWYRQYTVTIGIDGDVMLVQIVDTEGKSLAVPNYFSFPIYHSTTSSDILPRIQQYLCEAYLVVDEDINSKRS